MDREETRKVINDYNQAKDPMLQSEHSIKNVLESKRKPVSLLVATDGCAKGAKQTPDEKSFCGWGFSGVLEYASGRTGKIQKYGHLLNATPNVAELTAIEQALLFIDRPTIVDLVVDSSDAIYWLTSKDNIQSEIENHRAKPSHEVSREDKLKFLEMLVVERIQRALENPLIKGARISWVRAHSLEKVAPTEYPNPKEADSPSEKLLVTKILLNHMADLLANDGARKAIRKSLYGVTKTAPDSVDRRKVLVTVRKNLFYSYNVRNEAIDFVAKQNPGFLDQDALNALFTGPEQEAICEKRVLDEQRMSKHFSDVPKDRRDFLIEQERNKRNLASDLLQETEAPQNSPGKITRSDQGPAL
jgi:ribonuclease HI